MSRKQLKEKIDLILNKNKDINKEGYIHRAPIAAFLVFCLLVVEMGALIFNTQVSAGINKEVAFYEKQAMVKVSKNMIVMGDIYDKNEVPLVQFEKPLSQDTGTYADNYIYSPLIGYCQMGNTSGLLSKYHSLLVTTSNSEDTKGYSLHLTLDHELQKVVYQELSACIGSKGRGSMVVLDADSGKILSMVSMPVFDATNIQEESVWMNDENRSNGVWYPLATCGVIAPGSTFKLVSSIALLESGRGDFTTTDDTVYEGNGYTINNYSSYKSSGEQIDYRDALRKSSNVFFVKALLKEEDTRNRLSDIASRLYLGETMHLDFGNVISSWTYNEKIWEQILNKKMFNEERELATTLFGQSEVRMSSLQGAMLAAGIVNQGKIMTPYMIESVTDSKGKTQNLKKIMENYNVEATGKKDTVLSCLTDEKTADALLDAMRYAAVKQYGFDESLHVGAKSGTSETGNTGNSGNNAWLVSNAEINGHHYAIAINWANAAAGVQGKNMKIPVENIYHYLKKQQK